MYYIYPPEGGVITCRNVYKAHPKSRLQNKSLNFITMITTLYLLLWIFSSLLSTYGHSREMISSFSSLPYRPHKVPLLLSPPDWSVIKAFENTLQSWLCLCINSLYSCNSTPTRTNFQPFQDEKQSISLLWRNFCCWLAHLHRLYGECNNHHSIMKCGTIIDHVPRPSPVPVFDHWSNCNCTQSKTGW